MEGDISKNLKHQMQLGILGSSDYLDFRASVPPSSSGSILPVSPQSLLPL